MWPLLLVASLAAHGADLATTLVAHAAGRAHGRERNPLLAPLVDSPAIFGAVSMGAAGAVSVTLAKGHTTHPRLTTWIVVGEVVGETLVAIHNAHQLRR